MECILETTLMISKTRKRTLTTKTTENNNNYMGFSSQHPKFPNSTGSTAFKSIEMCKPGIETDTKMIEREKERERICKKNAGAQVTD